MRREEKKREEIRRKEKRREMKRKEIIKGERAIEEYEVKGISYCGRVDERREEKR